MMPSTLLTAATDIFVIAGAAAVAAAALKPTFRTSLGTEYDDDSLIAAETNDAVSTPEQQQSPLEKHADDDKKAPTVTISEVAVTPVAEMQGGDFFACAKAA